MCTYTIAIYICSYLHIRSISKYKVHRKVKKNYVLAVEIIKSSVIKNPTWWHLATYVRTRDYMLKISTC